MTTIPARLATLTRTSPSAADARKRVLSLYRDWYRSVSHSFAETKPKKGFTLQFYLILGS